MHSKEPDETQATQAFKQRHNIHSAHLLAAMHVLIDLISQLTFGNS